ncbi:hypothetical protein K438DRAFT_854773 [Mycena galopus ATCC 62051]|nr:hypothetical protein K438DRAFT_854773 [Mycena galopus ATCC 62051]
MIPQDDSGAPNEKAGAAARAANRARIADLETQIMEMERSLISLQEERITLQVGLTYPVLTLPNEIVSEIFLHFLPDFPKRPPPIGLLSPYLLCQICRHWRRIAFATPALWSAISLSFGKIGRFPQKLRYLDTALKLSCSRLISIQLKAELWDKSILSQLAQRITEHCARWEYL